MAILIGFLIFFIPLILSLPIIFIEGGNKEIKARKADKYKLRFTISDLMLTALAPVMSTILCIFFVFILPTLKGGQQFFTGRIFISLFTAFYGLVDLALFINHIIKESNRKIIVCKKEKLLLFISKGHFTRIYYTDIIQVTQYKPRDWSPFWRRFPGNGFELTVLETTKGDFPISSLVTEWTKIDLIIDNKPVFVETRQFNFF